MANPPEHLRVALQEALDTYMDNLAEGIVPEEETVCLNALHWYERAVEVGFHVVFGPTGGAPPVERDREHKDLSDNDNVRW